MAQTLDLGLVVGKPGANGVSPTIEVSKSGKVTTLTIKDAGGTKTATINDGEDGGGVADSVAWDDVTGKPETFPPEEHHHETEVLWTGSWESGTITVPDTSKYTVFKIGMSGQGTSVLAVKQGTHVRGIGGYSSSAPAIITYHFTATFEGDKWTFVACNRLTHSTTGSHSSFSENIVTSVMGVC